MPINIKYRVDENGNKIDTPPQSREHDTPIAYDIPPRTVSSDGTERRNRLQRELDLVTYDWLCMEDRMEALVLYIRNIMRDPLYAQDKPFLMYIWNRFKEFYAKDPDPPVYDWREVHDDSDETVYRGWFC